MIGSDVDESTKSLSPVEQSLKGEEMKQQLLEAIQNRTAKVGVIGLGYVGLPLVEAFGRAGFPVHGFDIDAAKVDLLRKGESYISRVSSDWIKSSQSDGQVHVTTDFRHLQEMNAILVCVPTPLTKAREPDLSYVRATTGEIRRFIERGQLIVLESTTYPGTTEEVIKPILEETGLDSGSDFFLAFSPEREDPGNPNFTTSTIPKLVGGVDDASGDLAHALYSASIERVVKLSHAKVAEAAKILENIYRAVNIALVNELKVLFDRMGIDVWEVISAASTKPFGFHPFYPGPGLGGHCIPIDPFYLTWKAREFDMATRFIELAGEVNTQMPYFVVGKLTEALNKRSRPLNSSRGLIIGVAYKPDIEDVRESPAFKIMELLQASGVQLSYHDPFVPKLPVMRHYEVDAEPVALTEETLAAHDFSLIVTDHSGVDWDLVVAASPLVVDTRNATQNVAQHRDKIVKA